MFRKNESPPSTSAKRKRSIRANNNARPIIGFDEAFAPLAFHLFPDGCPPPDNSSIFKNDVDDNESSTYLQVWPKPPKKKNHCRAIVSAKEAMESYKKLQYLGKRNIGFTTQQLDAMIVVACATLLLQLQPPPPSSVLLPPPKSAQKLQQQDSSSSTSVISAAAVVVVVKRSPFIDGTSRIFREMIRFNLLPRSGSLVSKFVVKKLVHVLLRTRSDNNNNNNNNNKNKQTQQQPIADDDLLGKSYILQFLTLLVRNGALSGSAKQFLSSMYPMLFSFLFTTNTSSTVVATDDDDDDDEFKQQQKPAVDSNSTTTICADTVRLLLAITRRNHVRVFRAQRLYDFYIRCHHHHHHSQCASSSSSQDQEQEQQRIDDNYAAPVSLLLQLYAQYDPQGCGKFIIMMNNHADNNYNYYYNDDVKAKHNLLQLQAKWFAFPDHVWERNFHQTWNNRGGAFEEEEENGSNNNHNQDDRENDDNCNGCGGGGGGFEERQQGKQKQQKYKRQVRNNSKRQKTSSHRSCHYFHNKSNVIATTLDRLTTSLEGGIPATLDPAGFIAASGISNRGFASGAAGAGVSSTNAISGSSLLSDTSLTHLMLLSSSTSCSSFTAPNNTTTSNSSSSSESVVVVNNNDNKNNNHKSEIEDVARLRVCLPFMLQQEWYHRSKQQQQQQLNNTNRYYSGDTDTADDDDDDDASNNTTSDDEDSDEENLMNQLNAMSSEQDGKDERTKLTKGDDYDSSSSIKQVVEGDSCHLGRRQQQQQQQTTRSSDRARTRRRLLEALSCYAIQTGSLPTSGAESMVLDVILPTWDGSGEWGTSLCYDILPAAVSVTTTRTFMELKTKLLVSLEKLFLYGSTKLRYAIVSGTLTSLLTKLAAQVGSSNAVTHGEAVSTKNKQVISTTSTIFNQDADNPLLRREQHEEEERQQKQQQQQIRNQQLALAKRKLIKEFIHWTDELLLRGFASSSNNNNGTSQCMIERSELLQTAAMDFYGVVSQVVSRHCNLLVLPSTSLVYRFLLSRSLVSINRVCQLLVDYKGSIQSLRPKQQGQSSTKSLQDTSSLVVEGLDCVPVFNCFVWDLCSALWNNSLFQQRDSNNHRMSILCTELSKETLAMVYEQQQHDEDPYKSKIIASSLSITHGAVFVEYAERFLDIHHDDTRPEQEEADGKPAATGTGRTGRLSLDQLKGKLKQEYLDYLKEDAALDGLHAFLTTFIGSLSKQGTNDQGNQNL